MRNCSCSILEQEKLETWRHPLVRRWIFLTLTQESMQIWTPTTERERMAFLMALSKKARLRSRPSYFLSKTHYLESGRPSELLIAGFTN